MSKHLPPIPPASRHHVGPGDEKIDTRSDGRHGSAEKNLDEQDRQGNIKQNTTNQGYQQDR